jgi:hypothetical protein
LRWDSRWRRQGDIGSLTLGQERLHHPRIEVDPVVETGGELDKLSRLLLLSRFPGLLPQQDHGLLGGGLGLPNLTQCLVLLYLGPQHQPDADQHEQQHQGASPQHHQGSRFV